MKKYNEKIIMKTIPCNICGASDYKVLYPDELNGSVPLVNYDFSVETRKTFQIVQCRDCGLIYTNPMPELSTCYEDTLDHDYLASKPQRIRTALHTLEVIRKFKKKGKLLDIGCATGIFLDEASHFFEVQGLELSRWAADQASKKHVIHRKPLDKKSITDTFDVITLFGVIEHFEDPAANMKIISSLLKPDGILVIYTGDVDAALPRALGKKWWWYQGMHLYYFSYKTLNKLLHKYGLDVINKQNYVVYFQLFSLAKSLMRYRIGTVFSPILTSPLLRNFMIPLKLSGEMLIIARRKDTH